MYDTLLLIAQATKSGVPLSAAIRLTVGNQPGHGHVALLRFADLLDKGTEPKVAAVQSGLPRQTVALLDTALVSGDFAGTFGELAKLEISRTLAFQRILQTMTYPCILFVSSVFLLWNVLTVTTPQFKAIFDDFGTGLPAMTAWVIQVSNAVRSPVFLLGLAVFVLSLYISIKTLFPRFWLCVPVLGHIGRCLNTTWMLRQLANHVSRNMPLPEALEECGKAMRNSAYRRDCRSAAAAARNGMPLTEIVIRYYWLFPTWLSPMIAVDDTRESLAKSLRRAAETVEQQQDGSTLTLQTISLPLYLMLMFSVTGFFVTAMFMPLLKLITDLSA